MSMLALFSLLDKPAGQLGSAELTMLSKIFKSDDSTTVEALFSALKDREPETLVRNLLGSKTVKGLVQGIKENTEKVNATIFCKCPFCAKSFEASIA
jgi:5'-3' exonuclease